MEKVTLKINNLNQTSQLAGFFAVYYHKHKGIIFLNGDLGAGKTTFTQFFAKELGIKEIVNSPTFNVFKRYENEIRNLNHFDLYRIKNDVYEQGFEEYWFSNDVSIIEWSQYLPEEFLSMYTTKIEIKSINDTTRIFEITGESDLIAYLKENLYEFIY